MLTINKNKEKGKIATQKLPEGMSMMMPEKTAFDLISHEVMCELRAFVFGKEGDTVLIATEDPSRTALQEFITRKFTGHARVYQATAEEVDFVIGGNKRDYCKEIVELLSVSHRPGDVISRVIELLLACALERRASDIHIEPKRGETIVRLRIDGRLHEIFRLAETLHSTAISRLKVLSNLKIDESRLPQDGRIDQENTGVSFRVSIVPTLYGEKAVLRLLTDSNKDLDMDVLGFSQKQQETILRNIDKPYGMIVASGPTGSGKTTTLYALVSKLMKSDLNISTLEDPIEYALSGVNQIQVNTRIGLTFASGLRSLLRQDPDIIMIGEIRDIETMSMATNAALTGHLVFATIHTNDAPSALTRFLEMKVEDFVVASIVNLIIAQRLVRRICSHCKREKKVEDHIIARIKERPDIVRALNADGCSIKDLSEQNTAYGEGCEKCLHTGYSGRVGIYELFEASPAINALVLQHASRGDILSEAEKGGFRSMVYDGVEKVRGCETTFEEVLRSTKQH